jgi:hypothetical protein
MVEFFGAFLLLLLEIGLKSYPLMRVTFVSLAGFSNSAGSSVENDCLILSPNFNPLGERLFSHHMAF